MVVVAEAAPAVVDAATTESTEVDKEVGFGASVAPSEAVVLVGTGYGPFRKLPQICPFKNELSLFTS